MVDAHCCKVEEAVLPRPWLVIANFVDCQNPGVVVVVAAAAVVVAVRTTMIGYHNAAGLEMLGQHCNLSWLLLANSRELEPCCRYTAGCHVLAIPENSPCLR